MNNKNFEVKFDRAIQSLINRGYVKIVNVNGEQCVELTEVGKRWVECKYN